MFRCNFCDQVFQGDGHDCPASPKNLHERLLKIEETLKGEQAVPYPNLGGPQPVLDETPLDKLLWPLGDDRCEHCGELPAKVCDDCGGPNPSHVFEPYQEEINDKKICADLCDACYHESCMDI